MASALLFALSAGNVGAQFTDVTAVSGIDTIHVTPADAGPGKQYIGLRLKTDFSNLGAAAALDVNADGLVDLLFARAHQAPVLYVKQSDGTFADETAARGLDTAIGASAFCAADFDNDGDVDLFVAPQSGPRYSFFVNDGSGRFTEEAVARGADVSVSLHPHQGYSMAAADYDRDGYLDVYLCEWGIPFSAENAQHSVLLRNRGSAAPGHFENVTARAGLVPAQPNRWSTIYDFSAAWADFDADGWPDLYVVGDLGTSRMYWNNGDGTFSETTALSGLGREEAGMGVAVGDYDHDGLLDLYVSSIYDRYSIDRNGTMTGNKLYRNLGGRRFAETSGPLEVDNTGWAWGVAFWDFNNDSRLDLVSANGMDAAERGEFGPFFDALTDTTALFIGAGIGQFQNVSGYFGITDNAMSKAVIVMDLENDGDEDLVVTNTFGSPILYRNDGSAAGRDWLGIKLRGTASNRDAFGAIVRVTTAAKTQTKLCNPTLNYLGQHGPGLHFGLDSAGATVERVEVIWPNGAVQTLTGLATNRVHLIEEPTGDYSAPAITRQPTFAGPVAKDQSLVLSVEISSNPPSVFRWEKDGVAIPGANQSTYRISRVHPFDAGTYRVRVTNNQGSATSDEVNVTVAVDLARHSVARWWNEFLLDAIRKDLPNPPVHARNLFHLSAAMWDAFWPYQEEGWSHAQPIYHRETVSTAGLMGDREAAQRQAISYAAYRVITERFKNSVGKARTLFGARWLMQQYGYDPDFTGVTGDSPAAVGNRIGYGVLAATLNDGANEANGYADTTGYVSANDLLIVALPGATMADPSRWQKLALQFAVSQNGIPLPSAIQPFVGVNAINTAPFALAKPTQTTLTLDPGAPPAFGGETHQAFVQEALDCILMSSMLDPADGVTIDISPGAYLNNPLGTNDGTGRAVNPFTGEAYAPNVVKRGDYARVLAEFWADGPSSETPPGHWNVIHNEVSDHPSFTRRIGGIGPELTSLEWDVRAYVALNGATHDAACAAWTLKRQYDSARPISIIRYLAGLGQSSDPAGPSYHAHGLPLIPNLIEVVTAETAAAGQRHAHLASSIGKIAIRAWRGNPLDPSRDTGGVGWILGVEWVPFQLPTFVSPAFPGYVSGHSTFSRAAAEALTLLTGSPYFPGGLGEYHFAANNHLVFERGPSADLTLQWATYYDAADQAGLSRLFGGIHPAVDDLTGRKLGARIGLDAFLKAQQLRHGAAPPRGLVNLSTRGQMGAGENVMIAGFVIEGTTAQETLVRMVGPELERYGIPAELCEPDPRFDLFSGNNETSLLANDDWSKSPRAAAIAARAAATGAFSLTAGGTDAAEVTALAPGLYTAVASSLAPAKAGIALAEVYGQKLINVSTRGRIGVDDRVLIVGFVVEAYDPMPVLVRGIGPSLQPFGISDVLTDPSITVYRHLADGSTEEIAANDDWSRDDRASLAQVAAHAAGAFSIPAGSKDAALFLQLPAGRYSAVVAGVNRGEGIALAEVYHVKF